MSAAAKPTLEEVAALMWARTTDDSGEPAGVWTSETRPTADQVRSLIDQAYEDIRALCVSGEIAERDVAAARRAVALRVAYLIEISYFPEQTASAPDNSPYLQLKSLADEAVRSFTTGGQLRDMFGVGGDVSEPDLGSGSGNGSGSGSGDGSGSGSGGGSGT